MSKAQMNQLLLICNKACMLARSAFGPLKLSDQRFTQLVLTCGHCSDHVTSIVITNEGHFEPPCDNHCNLAS